MISPAAPARRRKPSRSASASAAISRILPWRSAAASIFRRATATAISAISACRRTPRRWISTPGSRSSSAAAGTPSTPRHNIPRIGRVVIARGRDATDVAMISSFGPAYPAALRGHHRGARGWRSGDAGGDRRRPSDAACGGALTLPLRTATLPGRHASHVDRQCPRGYRSGGRRRCIRRRGSSRLSRRMAARREVRMVHPRELDDCAGAGDRGGRRDSGDRGRRRHDQRRAADSAARPTRPVGILPLGTVNVLGRDLGLVGPLERQIEALCQGEPVTMDIGQVNDRLFHSISGMGFFSLMAREREYARRRFPVQPGGRLRLRRGALDPVHPCDHRRHPHRRGTSCRRGGRRSGHGQQLRWRRMAPLPARRRRLRGSHPQCRRALFALQGGAVGGVGQVEILEEPGLLHRRGGDADAARQAARAYHLRRRGRAHGPARSPTVCCPGRSASSRGGRSPSPRETD